jgi:demethylmenaquinone methyltransferase/2-methoxy-6-polyprenyl-1,4-benzoquinol methylase
MSLSGVPEVSAPVLPPHRTLTDYYRQGQKSGFLRQIFDRTAVDYDRIEWLMAFGTGAKYRRDALLRAGLKPGMKMLDVAAGTGAVSREAITILGDAKQILGLDPSEGMLAQLVTSVPIRVLRATGEQLPLADSSFDFLSVGYALRHMSDLSAALSEFRRVLKPGGTVCLLEITAPQKRVARALARAYFRGIVPLLTRLAARDSKTPLLWKYYWDTIDACIPPSRVIEAMTQAGFVDVKRHVEIGIFSEYTGRKP